MSNFALILLTVAFFLPAGYYGSDVAIAANYIENNHSGINVGSRAFDNLGNVWASAETGAGVNGVSWIGQDFGGTSREIRRVGFVAFGTASLDVTQYVLEYSDDSANWSACGIGTLAHMYAEQYSNFPECGTHRYWRLLANSATASGNWYAFEIEMFEWIGDDTPTPGYIAVSTLSASGNQYAVERSASFGDMAVFVAVVLLIVVVIAGILIGVIYGRSQR